MPDLQLPPRALRSGALPRAAELPWNPPRSSCTMPAVRAASTSAPARRSREADAAKLPPPAGRRDAAHLFLVSFLLLFLELA